MQLVGPFVTTALARRVEMRAILAAEAEGEALALSVEFGRPRKPHHRSIVGLGVAVNLL
ncbi:MAG TPA: hypothetical protein VHB97_10340 [Polyangia bacterium]|jgi:hypothetical protein|nr:hypothetical protein [Polyangia bacterium]